MDVLTDDLFSAIAKHLLRRPIERLYLPLGVNSRIPSAAVATMALE